MAFYGFRIFTLGANGCEMVDKLCFSLKKKELNKSSFSFSVGVDFRLILAHLKKEKQN